MNSNAVIIVAAGRGQRMGGVEDNGPKQYRIIGTTSVLAQTISSFITHQEITYVQVVIHQDDLNLYLENAPQNKKLLPPVFGGKTRQESCRLGVEALKDLPTINNVLIHDAARPFVSASTISAVLSKIRPGVCALPCHRLTDTIKQIDESGRVTETLDRSKLWAAQTPQGFKYSDILEAHQNALIAGRNDLTDDAAVAEAAGLEVMVVEATADNMKITTPADLEEANRKMTQLFPPVPDIRVGNGYDLHVLEPGDSIILCGISIPHDMKLKGHSDADVGLHALTDAILGIISSGDIGHHFPPSDEEWKGANSDQFLSHAVGLLKSAGGTLTHIDVTLICERPKIGPHRDAMRLHLSQLTQLPIEKVSVKATTNERIGAIGREEGIAAIATATAAFGY